MPNIPKPLAAANPNAVFITTQAGGTLTYYNVDKWLNPNIDNPIEDAKVVDVYMEQVCFYVNNARGLIGPAKMRAVLSQPQSFYEALLKRGPEAGSAMLRANEISKEEFQQLEYFFIPMNLNEHSSLIVISPLDRTIELADSNTRSHRAMSKIFYITVGFLIQELGQLTGDRPWKFLYRENAPTQNSFADCGNYTCLYAKTLALRRPLTAKTDIGQGPNYCDEHHLKNLVINELTINPWTEELFYWGNEDPSARHYGPNTKSVPQHRLFWTHDPKVDGDAEAVNLRALRSRTGKFDHYDAYGLAYYCAHTGNVRNPMRGGTVAPRYIGYEEWARLSLGEFRTRVEEREADILNGEFP
jgi:hypothetical protein